MNCPSHMTLFGTKLHSYRELPLRYAEFATLYRYEKTGELTGLTRVRALTQDDCHVFCTEEQVESEFGLALKLIQEVLTRYGFSNYRVRLSLRGTEPGGKYVADDDKWGPCHIGSRRALDANGVEYYEAAGEAAFYGPRPIFQTTMGSDANGPPAPSRLTSSSRPVLVASTSRGRQAALLRWSSTTAP